MPRADSMIDFALNFAAQGKTILWVDHYSTISATIRTVDPADSRVEKIYLANRRERITTPKGGQVVFFANGSAGYRGMNADALFVEGPTWRDKTKMADLLPTLTHSEFLKVGREPFIYVFPERVSG